MSEGHTFADSFFDTAAAITTGGLSTEAISIESSPSTKMILAFLMIIGRLEIIAIIYIFIPKLST
jgi:trk system potassium uptake protein TrkH